MRRLLGALVLVLLTALTACGGQDAPTASDTASSESASSDPTPTSPPSTPAPPAQTATDLPTTPPTKSPPIDPSGVTFELLEIVSGTAAGGQASLEAVAITSAADADAFTAAFRRQLAGDVKTALAEARRGGSGSIYAAVVGLGCDIPPGVTVTESANGYTIIGTKVADPMDECFAAVTSVAVVAITE